MKFTKHRGPLRLCKPDFEDLTNVAAEFYGIALWQNSQTESWNDLSPLESLIGILLTTEVHVLSDSVSCVGKTTPLQSRHGRQNYVM